VGDARKALLRGVEDAAKKEHPEAAAEAAENTAAK
jgi:hypothetical protein